MAKSSQDLEHALASVAECGAALYLSDPWQMREYLRGYAFVASLALGVAMLELILLAI